MNLGRDPFARTTTKKREVTETISCSWCGGYAKGLRNFELVVEHDSGKEVVLKGVFCSMSCARSYHSE